MNNDDLIKHITLHDITLSWKSPHDVRVLDAMRGVDRGHFIPPQAAPIIQPEIAREYGCFLNGISLEEVAYLDMPIPIGDGQTCSQPSLVRFMIDILNLKEGSKVLEIGTGCGYQTAILKNVVRGGPVLSIEYRTELVKLARNNLKNINVVILEGDGSCGFPTFSPYDAIIFCAQVSDKFNPKIVGKQVPDGVLLYPSSKGFLVREKYRDGILQQQDRYGKVEFVPLLGENC